MRRLVAAAMLVASVGLGVAVSASPASAAATCTTITTNLPSRVDSGNHGDWAHDQLTRKVVICEAAVGYHATVTDDGTFTTVAGSSPQAGVPLVAGVTGTVHGSFTADFTAPGLVLGALTGPPVGTGTSVWVQTIVGGAWTGGSSINDDWAWTYDTCSQSWRDAADNQDGELPADGDITGKACPPAPPAPAPVPETHPTTAKPGTTHAPTAQQTLSRGLAALTNGSASPSTSPSTDLTPSAAPSLGDATSTALAATPPATDGAIATKADTSDSGKWLIIGPGLVLFGALSLLALHFRRKANALRPPRDMSDTAILPKHGTEQP